MSVEYWRPGPTKWRAWQRPAGAFGVSCRCRFETGYWAESACRLLTREEEQEADAHGLLQWQHSQRNRAKDSVNEKSDEMGKWVQQMGARGEMSWGIFDHRPWPKLIDDYKNPDYPPDERYRAWRWPIEIRTGLQGYPNMVLRKGDFKNKSNHCFIACVLHADGVFRFHGWGKPEEFIDYPQSSPGGKQPATFVHISDLHRLPLHDPKPLR